MVSAQMLFERSPAQIVVPQRPGNALRTCQARQKTENTEYAAQSGGKRKGDLFLGMAEHNRRAPERRSSRNPEQAPPRDAGEARAQRCRALFSGPDFSELEASGKPFRIEGDAAAAGGFVDTAFKAIKKESGADFHQLPHVAAFLQAGRGYADDIPNHYPRTDDAPDPAAENFHWFVQNGKDNGPGKALPPILGETALPLLRNKD